MTAPTPRCVPGLRRAHIAEQRNRFLRRRLPPERLRAEAFPADDPKDRDRTYAIKAALNDGYRFDRTRFRAAQNNYRSTDLAHRRP